MTGDEEAGGGFFEWLQILSHFLGILLCSIVQSKIDVAVSDGLPYPNGTVVRAGGDALQFLLDDIDVARPPAFNQLHHLHDEHGEL